MNAPIAALVASESVSVTWRDQLCRTLLPGRRRARRRAPAGCAAARRRPPPAHRRAH